MNYHISGVSKMIRKTRKCKLHKMLKKVILERIDPLAVELAAKLSCMHDEDAKYPRDSMQQFLSGTIVIPGPMNYKHFISLKNDEFTIFEIGMSPPVTIQNHYLLLLKC